MDEEKRKHKGVRVISGSHLEQETGRTTHGTGLGKRKVSDSKK